MFQLASWTSNDWLFTFTGRFAENNLGYLVIDHFKPESCFNVANPKPIYFKSGRVLSILRFPCDGFSFNQIQEPLDLSEKENEVALGACSECGARRGERRPDIYVTGDHGEPFLPCGQGFLRAN